MTPSRGADYAGTRAALQERARSQRAWMEKGVKNARRKKTDNDKFVARFRAEPTNHQPLRSPALLA